MSNCPIATRVAEWALVLVCVLLAFPARSTAQVVGFTENRGQWPEHVQYALGTDKAVIWLERGSVSIRDRATGDIALVRAADGAATGHWVGLGEPTHVNRMIGAEPAGWQRSVPSYPSMSWSDDSGRVLRVSMSEDLRVSADGGLSVRSAASLGRLQSEQTHRIGSLAVSRSEGAHVDQLSTSEWLIREASVEDEVVLWASLLGTVVSVPSMALRPNGHVVVAGRVFELDFPTTPGAVQSEPSSDGNHAFVAEVLPGGLAYAWATYLGGDGFTPVTYATSVTVAGNGDALVVGFTTTAGFPTTPDAWKPEAPLGADMFATLISADGTTLVASTLLGSDLLSGESCTGVAIAPNGNIALVGSIGGSIGFPFSADAYQGEGVLGPAFVTILTPDLSEIVASTALSGSAQDRIEDIIFDDQNRPIVVGRSGSLDFPLTENGWNSELPPWAIWVGAFAARFSADLTTLEVCTQVGAAGRDRAFVVDRMPSGEIKVAGQADLASLSVFPVSANALKTSPDMFSFDYFVCTFSPDLDELLHSTLLGGGGGESTGIDVVVDSTGLTYLVGGTQSNSYPTTKGAFAEEPSNPQSSGDSDGIVSVLHPSGAPLLYSTHVPLEQIVGLDIASNGDMVFAGGAPDEGDFPSDPRSTTGTQVSGGNPGGVMRFRPLPSGVARIGEADSAPSGLLVNGVLSQPFVGARLFGFYCLHVPRWSDGWLLVSPTLLDTPLVVGGASLLVDPTSLLVAAPIGADGYGWAQRVLPVPDAPELAGSRAFAQWLWPNPDGAGWLSSDILMVEVP